MIYLIDDKKKRQQQDFEWTHERLLELDNVIQPIYSIEELEERSKEIFQKQNIVLYHESFLDNTLKAGIADRKRQKLEDFAGQNEGFQLAIFSGSKQSRSIESNVAYLPVAMVYQNLELLCKRHINGNNDLRYLLFGENPEIELELAEKLDQALKTLGESNAKIPGKNLFLRPVKGFIQNAVENADVQTLHNTVSDEKLSQNIEEWLSGVEYDNIFVPLCFGKTLSDFNGLRFATHIRCTPTKNQSANIFIYGFVGIDSLLNHEYFNILKTKGVRLVGFSKKAFEKAVDFQVDSISIQEVAKEVLKLKLELPKNHDDSHSVTNEWAIQRWASAIGVDADNEIGEVLKNVESNLYFKYLRAIHPVNASTRIPASRLEIRKVGNPKILLIDDEADKGWCEIFDSLFGRFDGIYFDYLGYDFRNFSNRQIIEQCYAKIENEDIDVVILDFRLSQGDFFADKPESITSIELLRKIKAFNPGIQVIVFSASNKVWNLQALQIAGADGFVQKAVGENVNEAILELVDLMNDSLKKAGWLKRVNKGFKRIERLTVGYQDQFRNNLRNNFSICFDMLAQSFVEKKYLNYAYLQLYLCIEEFLKNKDVFQYGDKCYVNRNIKVAQKIDERSWNSSISYNPQTGGTPSFYSYAEHTGEVHIGTDYKVSAILILLFNQDTSDCYNWPNIRDVRNRKAAHPEKSIVTNDEIMEILDFLEILFDQGKRALKPKIGLADGIEEESLKALREKFGGKKY